MDIQIAQIPSVLKMNSQLDATTVNKLIEILQASPAPLSTREIGFRLRKQHLRLPDHEVSSLLRNMLHKGQTELNKSRWASSIPGKTPSSLPPYALPLLSKDTLSELGSTEGSIVGEKPGKPEIIETEGGSKKPPVFSGRWGFFRKLLAYYRQCIRNEEGAEASAFQNESGSKFIYLHKTGKWYPKPGLQWRTTIPIGPHLSGILNSLPSSAEDQSLVVGYPVQATYINKKDEPNISIISPVFFFTLEHVVSNNGLILSCSAPKVEINLKWLEYAFARKPDQQRNFLSACGFINRWQPNDEAPGLEKGELSPSMESLITALSAFMPKKIQQPLTLESVPDHIIHEPFDTGIYNRAVLMIARRTRYTSTLLKELAIIEKVPDDLLERTALRHIFTGMENILESNHEDLLHEAVVSDTSLLNAEQRRAISSLLNRDITVITGPPGTGKSQVVAGTITNARLRNESVLFASRNHKAIDAVVSRLNDPEGGQQLIIRTNSKEDPSLNITFKHAITDILAFQHDNAAAEQLSRVREDLFSLLEERGQKALFAHQAIEAGNMLGEIEENMSYLAEKLPPETAIFISEKSKIFPSDAINSLSRIFRDTVPGSHDQKFFRKVLSFFKALRFFPSYRLACGKIYNVPGLPQFPSFPSPIELSKVANQVPLLDRAAEYANLRNESLDHENNLKELPPLEETTKDVARLSERIKDVVSRAIPLDVISRQGLRPGVDRQELDGLRAALNAMRTGLDEGNIQTETLRVLTERTPYILDSFPCWAVTNLSVGSRLPLLAGMFDLAIVDEASQSDIPSAIPILFRAKRAGAVGDPHQLTHSSKLSTAKDTMLRKQVNIECVDDVRYAYTESSLYNLFAGTRVASTVFLSETYRNAYEIADYSNAIFYKGRLRVATDCSRLKVPNGMKMGIGWTDVSGEVKSGGGSGCYCQAEVEEVVRIVRTMLLHNRFSGTLGIVTPFRQQANRIRDALFESDSQLFDALRQAEAHVDTSHGFQGDERDVIIFSICGGPEMPAGSRSFLRETGNLFNVAVSRARAVLNVVGNQTWARRCGIRHIERLAAPKAIVSDSNHKTPWHPFESPYEEILFNALKEVGLEPRPQLPVSSRRMDMALVREGEKPLKIDIEVDGDCHRNSNGSRKIDDHWRDIQLQGLGWQVMRFWTYQLREDLPGCVEKIRKAWSSHE